jgi:hypothetical protein
MKRASWLLMLLLVLTAASGWGATRESKFLWISDLHFDPMSDAALVSELAKAEASEWEAILERTSPTSFSQYGSDTNWWLLKSSLRQFPKTLRHPAFVMVTGDLLAHGFPQLFQAATHDDDQQHYRAFVLKTVEFLALELKSEFPHAKVFLTPGNNDNDCGDYSIQANGDFLRDTATTAQKLAQANDDFLSDWKALGSFNVPHPTVAKARLISINSVFLSQKYNPLSSSEGCKPVTATAGADLMAWLDKQLATAAQSQQKVWLMFHIPPGIDGYATAMKRRKLGNAGDTCAASIVPIWGVQWTGQFDALLEKYRETVVASFAAHIHSDDFRLVGAAGGKEFVLMNPAISPIYQQNPGFRIVNYNGDGRVLNHTTYDLTNLSQAGSKVKGKWRREYTYTREWKQKELSAASLSALYDKVVSDAQVRADWLKLYAVSGPALEGEKPIVRALYCAVAGLSVEGYRECYCVSNP